MDSGGFLEVGTQEAMTAVEDTQEGLMVVALEVVVDALVMRRSLFGRSSLIM